MDGRTRTATLLVLLALGAGLLASGCVIRPAGVVVVGPPVEYGYQPMLYHGYVVYYTDDGIPFYWSGGARVWVPVAYRTVYVDHWRANRAAYVRWHSHRGDHYRSRRYKGQGHQHGYRPERGERKPTLRPRDSGGDEHGYRPERGERKPTLRPTGDKRDKREHKEKKEKKDKKKKKTLRPKD